MPRKRQSPGADALRAVAAALATTALLAWIAAPADAFEGVAISNAAFIRVDDAGGITAFDTDAGTHTSEAPITGATAVAVSPDGQTAWVTSAAPSDGVSSGSVVPVSLGTDPPVVGAPVPLPGSTSSACAVSTPGFHWLALDAVAITPDGRTLFAADSASDTVYRVDLAGSGHAVSTIGLPHGSEPAALAVTSDGSTVYVADAGTGDLTPIDVATSALGVRIPLGAGTAPDAVALTPSGDRALVAEAATGKVVSVGLPAGDLGSGILTGGTPGGIVITPDGATAAVTTGIVNQCFSTASGTSGIVPIDLATDQAEPVIPTSGSGGTPQDVGALAVSPDAAKAWASSGTDEYPYDLATGTQGHPIAPLYDVVATAIAPDQSPTAAFNISGSAPGTPVSFDASSSEAATGSIARYDWDFGDGATASTSTSTITHTYASPGTYTVTLTVTDSAGTSTDQVSTGSTLSRDGSPAATATRELTVSNAALPEIQLSPSPLDFGGAAPGATTQPRAVTVTNSGPGAATISAVTVGGADQSAFAVTTDGCSGQVLPASGSCQIALMFRPGQVRAYAAVLQISDDAAGGEQSVGLTGQGRVLADLSGTVTDTTRAGTPPLAGADVEICPDQPRGGGYCQDRTTDAAGHYNFDGLAAGTWRLEVWPADATLMPGSAVVSLAPAQVASEDFQLHRPLPIPPGVQIVSADGTVQTGVPRLNWQDPFTVRVPADIDQHAPPGTQRLFMTVLQLSADDGSGDPSASGLNLTDLIGFVVTYGADGRPAEISQPFEGAGRELPTTASTAEDRGAVRRAHGSGTSPIKAHAASAPICLAGVVRISPSSSNGVSIDMPWVDGNFHFEINPAAIPAPAPTGNSAYDFVASNAVTAVNAGINALPGVRQYNSIVTFLNTGAYALNGDPIGYVTHATNNYEIPALGAAVNAPSLGSALRGPQGAFHGAVRYAIWKLASSVIKRGVNSLSAAATQEAASGGTPSPDPQPTCSQTAGNGYIDPSGNVVTQHGTPVAGAKVVLRRASTAHGHLVAVPNGSAIMSPANRRNPDFTNALGHFGWDVTPGFYRVDASHRGCTTRPTAPGHTRVLTIPPPAVNLTVRLACRHLHLAPTRLALVRPRRRGPRSGTSLVVARIFHHGRGSPLGTVTFLVHGHAVAQVPVERRGIAAVALPRRARVTARYSGDGRFAPSRGRLK